jgi:GT2 family glycosyltransferase
LKYSVIIPVHNNFEYTKSCIQDLISSDNSQLECIVIDNASTDETSTYLSSLDFEIKVIRNNSNLGCARSWNQGIKISSGDWVLILNNDVRLSQGWLPSLINAAEEKNLQVLSPAMREGPLNYDFDSYATSFVTVMKNVCRKWTPTGACFAIKREVFSEVGLFDENFEIGQYEDADFFRRCKVAKIKMGVTGKSFIHHFGSITQTSITSIVNVDYGALNRKYHRRKWKISFLRRHFERYREKLLLFFWSRQELYKYGHSLLEKYKDGKIRYF